MSQCHKHATLNLAHKDCGALELRLAHVRTAMQHGLHNLDPFSVETLPLSACKIVNMLNINTWSYGTLYTQHSSKCEIPGHLMSPDAGRGPM
jgi:hypothetical protein